MEKLTTTPTPTAYNVGKAAVASFLEVEAAALQHNLQVFRAAVGQGHDAPRVGVVLKGNAYGHGLACVLPAVHPLCECLYVIAPGEAEGIRAWETAGGHPRRRVLVIGAVTAAEAVRLAQLDVEVVIGDRGFAHWAQALRALRQKPLLVHVHVDTGLGREGFLPSELPALWSELTSCADVLELRGCLSHFANVEDVTEQAYALEQVSRFQDAVFLLRNGGAHEVERHMAASAASLVLPAARLDILRVGISLYGLWPSSETRLSARVVLGVAPTLRPVLSWRAPSQLVRELPPGAYVGYGCTYRCQERTRIAVLPVGYFDGYPRLLSNRAHVLVHGQRCPVLGRVMMNHLIVDVTRAAPTDDHVVATLLGRDGDEAVTAENLAAWADTIPYEIVTRLGAHLERRLVWPSS